MFYRILLGLIAIGILGVLVSFPIRYISFLGGKDSVRMAYSTIKRLYRVNPVRWGYDPFIYIPGNAIVPGDYKLLEGLYYNSGEHCKTNWEVRSACSKSLNRVSLSFFDWLRFDIDRKRYEMFALRANKKRKAEETAIKNSESLDRILSSAQKDIDKLIKKSNHEISSSLETLKSVVGQNNL